MLKNMEEGILHVVLEHFSFEMQYLLDDFQNGLITFDQLCQEYANIGSEKHDIDSLEPILKHARKNAAQLKLHAGSMPWPVACVALRKVSGTLGMQ